MVDEPTALADRFEAQRPRLRAVAYRILGSLAEADDAVQETWLRLGRTDPADIGNLAGWLTTVVARVCLTMLRSRDRRREEPLESHEPDASPAVPEEEALLADSVGLALLVVLDTLSPAERVAFVLHDLFAVPFEEIAPLLEKTPAATRQLASRARRRVRGNPARPAADTARQRRVVEAFLAASRAGDFEALLSLLHPDVVLRADAAVGPSPEPVVLHGARRVAMGAGAARHRIRASQAALVGGRPGLVMAPLGRLFLVLAFTVEDDRITGIDVIAEPDRLREVEVAVLP